ncbi:MAG: hypothetical protein F6K45_26195 [Kamptonema sp. SIO1D9]|nr:hypothetical protein [Kamptonema sp. SIO1D9]
MSILITDLNFIRAFSQSLYLEFDATESDEAIEEAISVESLVEMMLYSDMTVEDYLEAVEPILNDCELLMDDYLVTVEDNLCAILSGI